jgi:hypothetical protein
MNPSILAGVFSITAAFSIHAIPIDDNAFYNTVAVRGTVRAEYGNQAVPGALVYAVSETGVETTMTDKNGHFYFLTLLSGDYLLGAAESGYLTSCICCRQYPVALNAGAEYDATVWLHKRCL